MTQWNQNPFLFIWKAFITIFAALFFTGCATVQNGGAPAPAFSYDQDLKELETLFGQAASIKRLTATPTDAERNSFIDARLQLINMRYMRFVRDLAVDKQHLDAGTDLLLMGINLSSAATSAIRAKTNLALVAAGVTGAKVTIDKHFYFDQTISALVSTMNAQRNLVLMAIISGKSKSINDYPLALALQDIDSYEMAGSLFGAIQVLTADASRREKATDDELRTLEVPTPLQRTEKQNLAAALMSLKTDSAGNLKVLNAILTNRRGSSVDIKDFTEAKRTVSTEFMNDSLINLPLWRSAITKAGVQIASSP